LDRKFRDTSIEHGFKARFGQNDIALMTKMTFRKQKMSKQSWTLKKKRGSRGGSPEHRQKGLAVKNKYATRPEQKNNIIFKGSRLKSLNP